MSRQWDSYDSDYDDDQPQFVRMSKEIEGYECNDGSYFVRVPFFYNWIKYTVISHE